MFRRNHPADWMWGEAIDLVERAERLQRQFFRPSRSAATWEPPVDVFEGDGELLIVVALPGVSAADVEILAEPGAIVVRAERPQLLAGACGGVRQLEIPYGHFERRVALPPGRFEAVSQEQSHGCLRLWLRRIG